MKTNAIRFYEIGGPEVLRFESCELTPPAHNEVRIRHTAIGLNFIDTYHRSGLYSVPLPSGLGSEAAGVVEAVGADVISLKVGDRVAYGTGPLGSYAEARNFPANRLAKLPGNVSDEVAAGMMLKGMTARYLLHSCYAVQPGDTIVMHAAAGGVGLILTQWAKALGARVIGIVGRASKIETAKLHGCDIVIDSSSEDVVKRVRAETNGKGVPVVYDGVGQETVLTSLDCLQPRGLLVSFGNASGAIKSFDVGTLAAKGSLYITRPTLATFTANDADFANVSNHVVEMVASGKVKINVNQRYALQDAAMAHADLSARKTTGTSVLLP
jgi:NADPH:quinone reductase